MRYSGFIVELPPLRRRPPLWRRALGLLGQAAQLAVLAYFVYIVALVMIEVYRHA